MIFNDRSNVIPYGVCDTPSGTAEKVVTVSPNISLTEGQLILVRFTYPNTASNPKLNVNNTGALNFASLKESLVGTTAESSWNAGQIVLIRYSFATSAYHWQTISVSKNNFKLLNLRADWVVVNGTTQQGPWAINATSKLQPGETFICWIDASSLGWVGSPYIEDCLQASTQVWASVASNSSSNVIRTYFLAGTFTS